MKYVQIIGVLQTNDITFNRNHPINISNQNTLRFVTSQLHFSPFKKMILLRLSYLHHYDKYSNWNMIL